MDEATFARLARGMDGPTRRRSLLRGLGSVAVLGVAATYADAPRHDSRRDARRPAGSDDRAVASTTSGAPPVIGSRRSPSA